MREHSYYVYMLTNTKNAVLYTGVTNNIARRLAEHRTQKIAGFTKKYNLWKLVYVEATSDVTAAITREKQIKGWLRSKKNALIESVNPDCRDLAATYGLAAYTCHPEQSEGSHATTSPDSSLRSE